MGNLSTTKEDGDSDTLAPFDKSPDIADLVRNIMGVGMRPHLDFFYGYEGLLLFCPVSLLSLEVAELPVVHDAAHRRLCLGGYLDQIQTLALHRLKGVPERHDPQLVTLGSNDSDLIGANQMVDSCFSRYRAPPFCCTSVRPTAETSC